MKQDTEKTRVIFRRYKNSQGMAAGTMVALFPAIAGAVGRPQSVQCYEHVGQHGCADYDSLMRITYPWRGPSSHNELEQELERIGYNVQRAHRQTAKDRLAIACQRDTSRIDAHYCG